MSISVYLWSGKEGELKEFLEKYFQKDVYMDTDVSQWIYVYNKPLEAVDLISAVIDNNDKYNISVHIQVDGGEVHLVDQNNHDDIVRGIFYLFYDYEQVPILMC